MKLKRSVSGLFLAVTTLAALQQATIAQVKINEGNGVNIVMENEAIKLNIAVEGGARISSFVNKKTGKDLVTMWKGPVEDGGMLDDRNVFTSFAYRAAVMLPGGKEGAVRLSAKHPSGMEMVKTLTLREGDSTLEVNETFSNGTQKEARFMLRSFFLPGGGPQSVDNQYFLPVKDKPLEPQAKANNYFENLAAPWSALWNSKSGEGVLIAAPGVEKFYFWQGSDVSPTYEWLYPNVPAGKAITVNYALQLVDSAEVPNWPQLSAAMLRKLPAARLSDVADWQNEEQRFQVNATERERGFWLSIGASETKRRIPQPMQIDVPLQQSRSVYMALNALKDFAEGDLKVRFHNIPDGLVQPAWQTHGKDFIKVLPFDSSTKVELKNGTEGRLWLTLNGGDKAVDAKGEIEISLGTSSLRLPLQVKVWPVRVPKQQPLDVKEYAGIASTIGYDATPEVMPRVNAMLKAFNGMGGSVMNWTVSWPRIHANLKIAGTQETASEWLKKNRAAFADKPASQWPRADFGYYDPWVQVALANGINRAATYLGSSTPQRPITPEQEWMLIQLREYLQAKGFKSFYCKIDDEMSPEHIEGFIATAKVARRAGWKTGTTITGSIARTATHINTLNPYCDIWEVGFGSTNFFKNLTSQRYTLEERTLVLPEGKWGSYGNGGATNTVGMALFKALIPQASSEVESMKILQDGKPLLRVGGSPWGNKKRGVFYGDSNYLYLSAFEDTDVKQSKFEVRYNVRVPSTTGETLAKLDAEDEVWFYGGPANAYRATYESSSRYPFKALEAGNAGFGWYDFHRWNNDKIVWYNEQTQAVEVGPGYLGLKNGWDDTCLIAWVAKTKNVPVSRFISEKADAPLRIGEQSQEVYIWKDVVNVTDPFILNDARRQVLAVAVQK